MWNDPKTSHLVDWHRLFQDSTILWKEDVDE